MKFLIMQHLKLLTSSFLCPNTFLSVSVFLRYIHAETLSNLLHTYIMTNDYYIKTFLPTLVLCHVHMYLYLSIFTSRPTSFLACRRISLLLLIVSPVTNYHQHKQTPDLGHSISAILVLLDFPDGTF
jgi:hypothetical protein